MGSAPEDPKYQASYVLHAVELAGFGLGRYEITWEEIAEFINEEGNDDGGVPKVDLSWEGAGLRLQNGVFVVVPGAARLPVTGISWRGALAYTEWLSRKTGEVYELPTEAEWEWAARAGSHSVWPWGDSFDPSRLNCAGGPEARPKPVGSYPSDANGIYDLLGNVWEWTLDCFTSDFYFYAPVRDPRQLDPCCWAPGIRGGSFRDSASLCHPGYRINYWWRGFPGGIGFRVARRLERM
jgi:formylglycine-generating enzyme required for sulfatase activity